MLGIDRHLLYKIYTEAIELMGIKPKDFSMINSMD